MSPLDIPEVVIDRLPVYFRLLSKMRSDGQAVVSSHELGEALGVTPAQIRKDLSYFGRFGKQGRGYSVERLSEELRAILGLDHPWNLVLVGMGRLGQAIASYGGFSEQGFAIVAVYDAHPGVVGREFHGFTVRDVRQIERDLPALDVQIGVVAVPAAHAQLVADTLVRGGVRAILNYAPMAVQVPPGVEVRQVDPVLQLQSMTYHLTRDAIEPGVLRRAAGGP